MKFSTNSASTGANFNLPGYAGPADQPGNEPAIVTYILGTGNTATAGSAADSQHIAAEFVSVLSQTFPRPAVPSIALTTDTSMLTASANDFGFDGVFERQVEALGRAGDVLMGITTSGNSTNVLKAVARAKQAGMTTIGLSGRDGGRIREAADQCIVVPSDSTQHIQEAHIAIGHILCDLVERSLFEKPA